MLPDERAFFRAARPWGFILFARNCSDRAQVSALCARIARDAWAMMPRRSSSTRKAAAWRGFARRTGARVRRPRASASLYDSDAAQGARSRLSVRAPYRHDLREVGMTVDCAPVLDVPVEGAHDVIGDRAYAAIPPW